MISAMWGDSIKGQQVSTPSPDFISDIPEHSVEEDKDCTLSVFDDLVPEEF